MAQAWQKDGLEEALIAGKLAASDEQKKTGLIEQGMSVPIAAKVITSFNEYMGRCILALY